MAVYAEHFWRHVQEIEVLTFHLSVQFEWFIMNMCFLEGMKSSRTKELDLQKLLIYK